MREWSSPRRAAGRIRAAAIVLWNHAAVPLMPPIARYPSLGMPAHRVLRRAAFDPLPQTAAPYTG